MNTVSIIIPVYQISDYVERCIWSVMNQTYTDIECIIVNDATNDDSIDKCEGLIKNYKGPICFRIISHEYNRGLSAARNTGTIVAIGDYIYYLDGDDEITADCIEKLIKVAWEHPNAEMVMGNANITMSIVAWNKLIKRSFIEKNKLYFKEGIIHEDNLWSYYLQKYLSEVVRVSDVTYYYRKRAGSISSHSDAYTIGNSFSIIYNDILHHLTPGRETSELAYYAGNFCSSYLKYKKTIPSYVPLYQLYRKHARHNSCWSAYIKLLFVNMLSILGCSYEHLLWLHKMKSKFIYINA